MCLFLIYVLISVQKKQNTFISSKQEPRHLRCSASVNISRRNSTTAEDDLSHTHTHTVSDFTDYQRKHLMNAWTHCRCLTCLHIFTRNSTQVSLEEQQQTRRWARNADQNCIHTAALSLHLRFIWCEGMMRSRLMLLCARPQRQELHRETLRWYV